MPVTEEAERSQTEFAAACMAHLPAVLRYIRVTTRCAHDAEDLAQDVFVKALGSEKQLSGEPLSAWLHQIARNRVAEFYRRRKVERRGADEMKTQYAAERAADSSGAVILQDSHRAALNAIDALDDNEREALTLKFSGAYTNIQIAGIMSLTPGNLGVILCRALKKVRQMLKEQGHELE